MTPPRSVEDVVDDIMVFMLATVETNDPTLRRRRVTETVIAHAAEQVAQARAEEQEACARIYEGDSVGESPDTWGWHQKDYARAIRARP